MLILGLDISSKTGWALLEDEKLIEYGLLTVSIEDFNVQKKPERSPKYPINLINAANQMSLQIEELIKLKKPDVCVIENTTKSRNRSTQRLLEFIHFATLSKFISNNWKINYLDVSEWRKLLEMRLSKEDKKNNSFVSKGLKKEKKIRGRITPKHLSVRWVNQQFSLKLKIADNNQSDAICLASAYFIKEGIK